MRLRIMALALIAATSATYAFEPELRDGETLVTRVDGDLDGDGMADTAWLTASDDKRELVVHLTDGATEALTLDTTPLGPGELSIRNGVLLFEDLTGGTTAIDSTRRYRYDKNDIRMRLIGYDATFYSRTQAHDGFEVGRSIGLDDHGVICRTSIRSTSTGFFTPTPRRTTARSSHQESSRPASPASRDRSGHSRA